MLNEILNGVRPSSSITSRDESVQKVKPKLGKIDRLWMCNKRLKNRSRFNTGFMQLEFFFFFFLLYLTGAICVCRLRSISILCELWENTSVSWAELWLTFMFRKLEDGKFVPTMWRQCSLNWLWGADVWSLIKKNLRTQNALCCNSDLSASSLRALFSSFMS